jgi:hypothetical protein
VAFVDGKVDDVFLGLLRVAYTRLPRFSDGCVRPWLGIACTGVEAEIVAEWRQAYLKEDLSSSYGLMLVSRLASRQAEKVNSASTEQ